MCYPRDVMPQVDFADYPGLFAHLNARSIMVRDRSLPPSFLRMRQCIGETRPCRRIELLAKPLLIAMDMSILDGDHRYLRHLEEKTPEIRCYEIGLGFEEAMRAILTYPAAYRLGDAPQPRRE